MKMSAGSSMQQWMCTVCGKKIQKSKTSGRPDPGICPRKEGKKPHSWVKNS
jgi:hypothetical protein